VHGEVRASGYRWYELGSTLAFTHEKTQICSGKRQKKAGWSTL